MLLFPTLVVDDFLDDPDYVLCLATNAEYDDPGYTNYPGVASKNKIHELDQELFNTISFDEEAAAGVNATAWFPLESQCPDADHYIHAYIVDAYGDVTWENKPTGKTS